MLNSVFAPVCLVSDNATFKNNKDRSILSSGGTLVSGDIRFVDIRADSLERRCQMCCMLTHV